MRSLPGADFFEKVCTVFYALYERRAFHEQQIRHALRAALRQVVEYRIREDFVGADLSVPCYAEAHFDEGAIEPVVFFVFRKCLRTAAPPKTDGAGAAAGSPGGLLHGKSGIICRKVRCKEGAETALGTAVAAHIVQLRKEHFPEGKNTIKLTVAQGNLVGFHVHSVLTPGEPGRNLVDIFRLENGKIVEHWDTIQNIEVLKFPPINDNGLY